jgi:hypothetical protein
MRITGLAVARMRGAQGFVDVQAKSIGTPFAVRGVARIEATTSSMNGTCTSLPSTGRGNFRDSADVPSSALSQVALHLQRLLPGDQLPRKAPRRLTVVSPRAAAGSRCARKCNRQRGLSTIIVASTTKRTAAGMSWIGNSYCRPPCRDSFH